MEQPWLIGTTLFRPTGGSVDSISPQGCVVCGEPITGDDARYADVFIAAGDGRSREEITVVKVQIGGQWYYACKEAVRVHFLKHDTTYR